MRKGCLLLLVVFIVSAFIGAFFGIKQQKKIFSENNTAKISEIAETAFDFEFERGEFVDLHQLKKQGLPILICYGDDEHCSDMIKDMRRVNNEYEGRAFVYYIDCEKYPQASENVFIPAVPTFIFIDSNGKPYVPCDSIDEKYGFQMYIDKITELPLYTYHIGKFNRWNLREILDDMGAKEE